MYHIIYSFSSDFVSNLKMAIRAERWSWAIYISYNIAVFKTVYPRTFVYLWLTNTTRMTHLEGHLQVEIEKFSKQLYSTYVYCIQWGGKRWGGHEISHVLCGMSGVGTWGSLFLNTTGMTDLMNISVTTDRAAKSGFGRRWKQNIYAISGRLTLICRVIFHLVW